MGAAKRGYRWIGELLAAQGIVTVGLNHYGESWIYGPEHIRHSTVLAVSLATSRMPALSWINWSCASKTRLHLYLVRR